MGRFVAFLLVEPPCFCFESDVNVDDVDRLDESFSLSITIECNIFTRDPDDVNHDKGGTKRVLEGLEKVDTTHDIVMSSGPTSKRRRAANMSKDLKDLSCSDNFPNPERDDRI